MKRDEEEEAHMWANAREGERERAREIELCLFVCFVHVC